MTEHLFNKLSQAILDCDNLGLPRCGQDDGGSGIEQLLSIFFLGIGAVSVLFILIGAGKLAAANGDPADIKKGRDTILYAIIGLVVSIFAFGIINFVIRSI